MTETAPDDQAARPPGDVRFLEEFLRDRDAPCPICGYNLRNLTSHLCPECGKPIRLQVGSADPVFGYLLAFFVPMLGLAGLMLIFLALSVFAGPPSAAEWGFYAIMAAGFVDAAAVIVLYFRRRLFLRKSVSAQRVLAGFSWVLHIVYVAISIKYGS